MATSVHIKEIFPRFLTSDSTPTHFFRHAKPYLEDPRRADCTDLRRRPLGCPSDRTSHPPPIHTPPLVFTRICSDWRAIALGTGSLWSCIDLFSEDPTLELRENAHNILATWSERARGSPLSWTLRGYTTLPPIFPILATQLHRLELNVSEPDLDVLGAVATSTGFPQLRELALRHHVWDNQEIPTEIAQVLASASAIKAISFSFSAPSDFTGAETPRLTTFQVKKITVPALRALFQHCSGLTHLNVAEIIPEDFPPLTAPITAPNLQTVVIPWDGALDEVLNETVMQFAHFSFPSLRYLHLPYTSNLHIVSQLFHRSDCSTDNLSVSISTTAQVLELQSIFDHMPSIATLEIRRWEEDGHDLIPAVILALSTPGVLPRLQNLTIHIGINEPEPYTVSYAGVVSLLDARTSPNSAFSSFYLDVEPTDPYFFAEKYTPPSFFLSRIEKLAQRIEIDIINREYRWIGGVKVEKPDEPERRAKWLNPYWNWLP
ncbi:hypothetical protein B0H11DRAFT_2195335 [Mycena galericulata]|nr:hypothetical protein B0H11DRAFT_2195335 [Mycena galericulata]